MTTTVLNHINVYSEKFIIVIKFSEVVSVLLIMVLAVLLALIVLN